jgi:hypothetical protein
MPYTIECARILLYLKIPKWNDQNAPAWVNSCNFQHELTHVNVNHSRELTCVGAFWSFHLGISLMGKEQNSMHNWYFQITKCILNNTWLRKLFFVKTFLNQQWHSRRCTQWFCSRLMNECEEHLDMVVNKDLGFESVLLISFGQASVTLWRSIPVSFCTFALVKLLLHYEDLSSPVSFCTFGYYWNWSCFYLISLIWILCDFFKSCFYLISLWEFCVIFPTFSLMRNLGDSSYYKGYSNFTCCCLVNLS